MEWMRTEWAVSEILWMHLMLFPPAIERALVSQQCTLHIRQQLQFSLWSWGILGFVWLELSNLWIGPLFHPFYHIAINGQKKNLETSTSLHSKSRIIQLIVTKWMGFRTNRKNVSHFHTGFGFSNHSAMYLLLSLFHQYVQQVQSFWHFCMEKLTRRAQQQKQHTYKKKTRKKYVLCGEGKKRDLNSQWMLQALSHCCCSPIDSFHSHLILFGIMIRRLWVFVQVSHLMHWNFACLERIVWLLTHLNYIGIFRFSYAQFGHQHHDDDDDR